MARRKKAPQKKPVVKTGPGRPSLYDVRRAKRIIESIKRGLTFKNSAMAAGISYNQFRLWRNRGKVDHDEKLDTELSRFYLSLKAAKFEGEDIRAKIITKAANRTWQAAAWWLERICHTRWGRKDHNQNDNRNANVNFPVNGNGSALPTKRELISQLQQLIASMPDEELTTIESNGHVKNGHMNGDVK